MLLRETTQTPTDPWRHLEGGHRTLADNEVMLVVPAAPEYLRLVRMTAAGLASRIGFTYDDIEDLRIAVDELCFVLVGSGRTGSIALTYWIENNALTIEGVGHFTNPADPTFVGPNELSEQILAAVVDEHTVTLDGDSPRFQLRKRASGGSPALPGGLG
jgi:serine/threonine-protein kinase RsbW